MVLEKTDKQTLRAEYISYMVNTGKSVNTANTTAANVFALWNKCGEEYFWEAINTDDASLRDKMLGFLETYLRAKENYVRAGSFFFCFRRRVSGDFAFKIFIGSSFLHSFDQHAGAHTCGTE